MRVILLLGVAVSFEIVWPVNKGNEKMSDGVYTMQERGWVSKFYSVSFYLL